MFRIFWGGGSPVSSSRGSTMAFNDDMDPTHQKKQYEMAGSTEDVDPSEWKEKEVVRWLNTLGLGDYGAAFMKHRITGDVLHLLSRSVGPT